MGCFSATKSSRRSSDFPPAFKTLLEAKQGSFPSARWKEDKGYSLVGASPSMRVKAKAIHTISRFLKHHHPPSLSGSVASPSAYDSIHGLYFSEPLSSSSIPDADGPALLPWISNPLFPLPSPPEASSHSVSSAGSVSSTSGVTTTATAPSPASMPSTAWSPYQSDPCPLPPPPHTDLREFSFEELAGACQNFSPDFWIRDGDAGPVYRATMERSSDDGVKMEVAITKMSPVGSLSLKKWKAEVNSLARISHPHLCKVIGFCIEDAKEDRFLVYEHAANGGLDTQLYGRTKGPPMDWSTRMRVALGAAQGLAYLHERTPKQVVYRSFKTINIQIDQHFNAKLTDYGFSRISSKNKAENPSIMDDPYIAPETADKQVVSDKSNAWSFGVVLLELLTGRQHMDEIFSPEERNLVEWVKPHLMDVKKLYLVMDPELKGRYPTKNAKIVTDLALRFTTQDPVQRPSLRSSIDILKSVQSSKFTKPEPPVIDQPIIRRSKSINSSTYARNSVLTCINEDF